MSVGYFENIGGTYLDHSLVRTKTLEISFWTTSNLKNAFVMGTDSRLHRYTALALHLHHESR